MIYTTSEEDGIPDFIVNDQDDYLAYPDALYSSKTLQWYNVSVGTILSVQVNIMIQWSRKQSRVAGATDTSCGVGLITEFCDHNYSFVEIVF